eukprot:m.36917 g.36917  ORF g.36917 m.36917 type:complete len:439 (+) comp32306_c0_seq7:96-1412(+)
MADVLVACTIGDAKLLKSVLLKSSPRRSDSKGYSALHHAVRRSYIECIQILLRDDRTNVNAKTKDTGSTPLHLCLSSRLRKKDRLQMVRILLEKGADVDSTSCIRLNCSCSHGLQTPLHLASREGHLECLEMLLRSGANFNAVDSLNHSPLDTAKLWGKRECARSLTAYQWAQRKNEKSKEDARKQVENAYKMKKIHKEESSDSYWRGITSYQRWRWSNGFPTFHKTKEPPCRVEKRAQTVKRAVECPACVPPTSEDDQFLDDALRKTRPKDMAVSLKPASLRRPKSYLLAGIEKRAFTGRKKKEKRPSLQKSASAEDLLKQKDNRKKEPTESKVKSLTDLGGAALEGTKAKVQVEPPSFLKRPALSRGVHIQTCQAWGSPPSIPKPNAFVLAPSAVGFSSLHPACMVERKSISAGLKKLPLSIQHLKLNEFLNEEIL